MSLRTKECGESIDNIREVDLKEKVRINVIGENRKTCQIQKESAKAKIEGRKMANMDRIGNKISKCRINRMKIREGNPETERLNAKQ